MQLNFLLAMLVGMALVCTAQAEDISDDVVRIGFIGDMSGVYADVDGEGSAYAIQLTIEEMGGEIDGRKIEFLKAKHQNKADIAASKARQWFDQENLDMLIAGANSAASVAMSHVAGDKQKPYFVVGGGSSEVTNDACTPYTVHYGYDTKSLANGTARALVERGHKSWFYIASDYVFGQTLEAEARKAVEESGG